MPIYFRLNRNDRQSFGEKEEILMFVYVSILSSSTEETSVGQKAHVP